MVLHYPELAERVRGQAALQPAVYGGVDFDAVPYRLTADAGVESSLPGWVARREPILADERTVELISTATLLGDVVADPYAALEPRYGTRTLVAMLRTACREGVDAVPDAPVELRAFLESMEAAPDWLDADLVEEGARRLRVGAAFVSPFITRGAFLATFLNTYAALPMALTGALTGTRAAHRINETANFFAVTTLPHALARHGEGFEAAAMVRLMHSMVRFHALTRPGAWNRDVYGIPIPQVDQMPAGLINMYVIARTARMKKRGFTDGERAMLEFCRYRCFLLGLPEELLPTTVDEIITVFHARAALLRAGFDQATCGALVRSSMQAYLRRDRSARGRIAERVERAWSTTFFVRLFCNGDRGAAAAMGVEYSVADRIITLLTMPFVSGRFALVVRGSRFPALRPWLDRYTTRVVRMRLRTYGHPEFVSDGATYATR
ncbi:oxygenase MpaB family protein [Tsukamurella sp. 1534]|uniref:oxygenase MpaB family protein n=1 Tax=Tsukamurella sp. 1534 TaxID=1151061 RepID=UPI00030323DB|nr:oxygenase MpaB family protein [Tsukamurella sp. 1534]